MCDFFTIKHNPENIEKLKEALLKFNNSKSMDLIWSPELDYKPLNPSDCWISVKDALPVDEQKVIVCEGNNVFRATFSKNDAAFDVYWNEDGETVYLKDEKITHWMEWPRPPIRKEDAKHDSL